MNGPTTSKMCRVACRVAMTTEPPQARTLAKQSRLRDKTPPPLQWWAISLPAEAKR